MTLPRISATHGIIEAASGQVNGSFMTAKRDGADLSRSRRSLGRRFVALLAIQIGPHILVASGDGEHPWAVREWRLMPYVLSMTTGQIGNPIAIFILVISDDRLLHVVMNPV